jgi:hypothetical protein
VGVPKARLLHHLKSDTRVAKLLTPPAGEPFNTIEVAQGRVARGSAEAARLGIHAAPLSRTISSYCPAATQRLSPGPSPPLDHLLPWTISSPGQSPPVLLLTGRAFAPSRGQRREASSTSAADGRVTFATRCVRTSCPPTPLRCASRFSLLTPYVLLVQINSFVYRSGDGHEPQSWPLIRKVVITGPWPVLASGACLVDLPGVRDANAARANVAATYLQNCSCLWIVAPIKRAVDDGTAKDLLGEQFKRRLYLDGQVR